MTSIPSQRHRFSIPDTVHYLNCAYMAPHENGVAAAIHEGVQSKQAPWDFKPEDFFAVTEEFRTKAAQMAGVSPDTIAIVPSVSFALATAAKNLPLNAGQQIVTLAEQFPSNVYTWREHAARSDAEMITVQREAEACWTQAVLNAIGDDTAIVAVPNCHWADGRIVDLEKVAARCREVSAALVLDLTQSFGAMPIDFEAVQPDFAVAACYKWLMGPYGIGMLYVAPKYHEGEPLENNWMNRANSQDFARLVDYRNDFQPGARRFDMGEKSNPAQLKGAGAAIDFLQEFGVEAIARTLGEKTAEIARQATAMGLSVPAQGTRAPHFLAIGFPDGVPEGLTERLAQRQVFVSLRGSSLRVTPHLYNDERDTAALIETLRASL